MSLKRHREPEGTWICPEALCGKVLRSKAGFDIHCRKHSGEKPYVCDQCPACFASRAHLRYHHYAHTGERPHVCPQCHQSFRIKSQFLNHYRQHTGETPYECQLCGIKYAHQSHLFYHMCLHTGKRPHPCTYPECTARFILIASLKKHIAAHHTVRGEQRRRREEEKVEQMLKAQSPALLFDREVHIDFVCANDMQSKKRNCRIDFLIHHSPHEVTLLEVDEEQHQGYPVACELKRMMDCYSSLLQAQPALTKVRWVRYNPHCFSIDGVRQRIDPHHRRQQLLDLLKTPPKESYSVLYCNYSQLKNQPVIFLDPDFSKDFRAVCRNCTLGIETLNKNQA